MPTATPVTFGDLRATFGDLRVDWAGNWLVDPGSGTAGAGAAAWAATLGAVTIGLAPYRWADKPGPFGIDNLRTSDTPRPFAHGLISGAPDRLASKLIDLPWIIAVDTETAALLYYETLVDAWQPVASTSELVLTSPARALSFFGRPRRVSADLTDSLRGVIPGACQFDALDPRGYGAAVNASVPVGATIGGLSLPHSFPHRFGSGSTGGTLGLINDGNTPSERTTISLSAQGGTLSNPRLELLETGEAITMTIDIAGADELVLDFFERTVTLNGTVSRSDAVNRPGSRWFAIPEGTSTLKFTGTGTGTAVVNYRPAWIL